ncbi:MULTISPECIES: RidA family protein [Aminobacter]|jgi:2-iminobutanoate/2-iminopropanoate deaminase|uniref:2-aminomuconate deaminase n=2 Tax=Aminobacter TaxID=31988 RepID=A0A380WQX0_AMIAI|nr:MULTISPECIES: RidA family protein [Aminobacter]MBA8909057.1 enamine deaminase RidA (YjgF/YER057c/UK114 family) [Aminobacter ciceronei]MBA9022829.1 enamine deaminase RidA (YjgF/YER057c/UK114 family) [Aminobacter ciceronei]TCS30409.1 enamine deaminase RidA (YjgF/YER057c/UK114 family) [Aminobacter aminovorans]WMC98382.1 RidA family protein [Aminobacter aminovorans]SUU91258.1 2-aminomuconate deaminase [Aminobacter aminovorans]
MSNVERLNPPGMAFPGMSQAVGCGDFVLVSGQVALKDKQIVAVGDPAGQTEQVFRNIEAVLAEAGLTLAHVVSLRCYLTSAEAYQAYAVVKNRIFADNPPAASAMVVTALVLPEIMVEVEAVAWRHALAKAVEV